MFYDGLRSLPIFDPDLDQPPGLPVVLELRRQVRQVRQADGLVIACPEYAHDIRAG